MLYENEIIEALSEILNDKKYGEKYFIKNLEFINFENVLFSNGSRAICLNILGKNFSVYIIGDNEDFDTIKQRTLYIIKNQLGSMFYQLEKILEKN